MFFINSSLYIHNKITEKTNYMEANYMSNIYIKTLRDVKTVCLTFREISSSETGKSKEKEQRGRLIPTVDASLHFETNRTSAYYTFIDIVTIKAKLFKRQLPTSIILTHYYTRQRNSIFILLSCLPVQTLYSICRVPLGIYPSYIV